MDLPGAGDRLGCTCPTLYRPSWSTVTVGLRTGACELSRAAGHGRGQVAGEREPQRHTGPRRACGYVTVGVAREVPAPDVLGCYTAW